MNAKGKLRSIDGSANRERNDALVKHLEGLLENAKDGAYDHLLIIARVRGIDQVDVVWEDDDKLALLGAMRIAEAQVLEEYLDEDADDEDDPDGVGT